MPLAVRFLRVPDRKSYGEPIALDCVLPVTRRPTVAWLQRPIPSVSDWSRVALFRAYVPTHIFIRAMHDTDASSLNYRSRRPSRYIFSSPGPFGGPSGYPFPARMGIFFTHVNHLNMLRLGLTVFGSTTNFVVVCVASAVDCLPVRGNMDESSKNWRVGFFWSFKPLLFVRYRKI